MIVGYKRACERSAAYMKRVQETEQSTYVSHDCFSNLHPSIIDEHMKKANLPISSPPPFSISRAFSVQSRRAREVERHVMNLFLVHLLSSLKFHGSSRLSKSVVLGCGFWI